MQKDQNKIRNRRNYFLTCHLNSNKVQENNPLCHLNSDNNSLCHLNSDNNPLHSPVTNKIILGEQDGITVLLKTMQRYSNNPIVMEAAVTALRNVSNKCSKLFLRAASDYRASRLQLRRSNLATCGYLWVSLVTYAWLSMLRLVINTTLGYGITAGLSGEIKTLCSLS